MTLLKKKQLLIKLFCLVIILISGALYGQNEPTYQWSKSVRSLTVFKPGDAVRIQILELYRQERRDLFLSGDYPINPEGYIVMPLIGEVKVKGYTIFEVMQNLRDRLAEHLQNPYVYVRPLIRIVVQGAFLKPGAYHVDPASSLWSVIELAGGPGKRCDMTKMHVNRGGKIVIPEVLKAFEKGISLEEVGIESGDQIIGVDRGGISITFLMTVVNVFTTVVLLYLRLKDSQW
ncbi:polysaccharide biosynthesis/export family protein [bacterium]|nr:polysaccharide biosynthesis/export family protein [bacterium]